MICIPVLGFLLRGIVLLVCPYGHFQKKGISKSESSMGVGEVGIAVSSTLFAAVSTSLLLPVKLCFFPGFFQAEVHFFQEFLYGRIFCCT